MGRMTKILDPRAESDAKIVKIAPFPNPLDGKVIGFLDNGKPNADILLGQIEEVLRNRFHFSEIVREKKRGLGATSADTMDNLARCDVVINGLGD